MSPSPDPTAEVLLARLQFALVSALENRPGDLVLSLSRAELASWAEQVGTARVVLAHPAEPPMVFLGTVALLGLVVGVGICWFACRL
jgi:hypothetical protein